MRISIARSIIVTSYGCNGVKNRQVTFLHGVHSTHVSEASVLFKIDGDCKERSPLWYASGALTSVLTARYVVVVAPNVRPRTHSVQVVYRLRMLLPEGVPSVSPHLHSEGTVALQLTLNLVAMGTQPPFLA